MPRRAHPSRSLSAAVRAHFGLSQAKLAAFIGVSRAHLGLAEAGTKTLGPAPDQRLQVLARQLPPELIRSRISPSACAAGGS